MAGIGVDCASALEPTQSAHREEGECWILVLTARSNGTWERTHLNTPQLGPTTLQLRKGGGCIKLVYRLPSLARSGLSELFSFLQMSACIKEHIPALLYTLKR